MCTFFFQSLLAEVTAYIFRLCGWLLVQISEKRQSRVDWFDLNLLSGSLVIASKSRSLWIPAGRWQSTQLKPSNKHRDGFVTHQGVRLQRREMDKKKGRAGGINRPYITGSC